MNAIKFGAIAKEFFESVMPGNIVQGYEKYIAVDVTGCVIVRSDYRPNPGEMVFLCSIRNSKPMVELYRAGKPENQSAN